MAVTQMRGLPARPLPYGRRSVLRRLRFGVFRYHRRVAERQDQSARFRSTRAAHRDETAEDYVEAILQIGDGEARVRDLAGLMGVSHVTVIRIMSRLTREGLVKTAQHRPVELTAKGRRLAARARERHGVV